MTDEDFGTLTNLLLELADRYAHGRVVSLLEGGYDLHGLAAAVTAHCRALVEHQSAAAQARLAAERRAPEMPKMLTSSLGPPEEWVWW